MARKARTPIATAVAVTAAPSSTVAPAPSIAVSGTRSKRKASTVSVSVSVATAMGSTASAVVISTVASTTPTSSAGSSAISPALKKRRTARAKVNAIPFPALYGSKEVINLYDDDDDDDEGDSNGYRSVDVAAAAPGVGVADEQTDSDGAPPVRVVHPDFHLPAAYTGRARVLHQRGEYFDAMLTRACVYQQQNEFTLLQVLEVDAREFFVWSRSGFVGTTGDTVLEGPWPSASDAIAKFRALFLSKTLHHWDERHAQGYAGGSFTWIEAHQTMNDDEETAAAARAAEVEAATQEAAAAAAAATTSTAPRKRRASKKSRARAPRKVKPKPLTELVVARASMPSETSAPPSRLDAEVQSFLSMTIDAANAYSSADHRFYAYAATKQPKKAKSVANDDAVVVPIPLGKLSKGTIAKGFETLHRLHDALLVNADRTALTHLSSHFFSLVPHPQLSVIDSMVRLTEKVEMLVALSVHAGHQDLLLPDLQRRYFLTNHVDACYESLDCRLFPLLPTSREYGLVQAYMFNSFCCVGNNYGAEGKLVTVFRVEKPSESSRFSAYRSAPNRRVLWHGSRMSNWLGILKHGLLITPAGVQLNGSSLGAGLYFTDKISKAMAYSHASHNHQVFLLSEVALGTCKPSTAGARAAAASSANVHHSCHGMGRCVPDSNGDYLDAFGAVWPLGKATQTKDARATHGHNEFVVYNTAQARMRYIVVTRPLY